MRPVAKRAIRLCQDIIRYLITSREATAGTECRVGERGRREGRAASSADRKKVHAVLASTTRREERELV